MVSCNVCTPALTVCLHSCDHWHWLCELGLRLNVLENLIFLCCNPSKSYLFCLLAVPILLITTHALAQTKCITCMWALWTRNLLRVFGEPNSSPHEGWRQASDMKICVFLMALEWLLSFSCKFWVLRTLRLQPAKNGCYTGTSIATFYSVLPFYNTMCIVMSDYAISLGNTPVPLDFLPIFPACIMLHSYLFFQSLCWQIRSRSIEQVYCGQCPSAYNRL